VAEGQGDGWEDRRQFKRVADSFPLMYRVREPISVRLRFGNRELEGIACDIGAGGMGVLTNHEVPVHTLVEVRFKLYLGDLSVNGENQRLFDLSGEIRYSLFTTDKSYRLGVCFVRCAPSDRDYIWEYVQRRILDEREGAA
jgi:c-di-GMP-binding flagellar brake protein YcgR